MQIRTVPLAIDYASKGATPPSKQATLTVYELPVYGTVNVLRPAVLICPRLYRLSIFIRLRLHRLSVFIRLRLYRLSVFIRLRLYRLSVFICLRLCRLKSPIRRPGFLRFFCRIFRRLTGNGQCGSRFLSICCHTAH